MCVVCVLLWKCIMFVLGFDNVNVTLNFIIGL